MNIILINDCAADGCYKKHLRHNHFCNEHYSELKEGKVFKAFYGKSVKIEDNKLQIVKSKE